MGDDRVGRVDDGAHNLVDKIIKINYITTMKVSPKKTIIAKFGVTLQPSKVYEATKEGNRYHVQVPEYDNVTMLVEEKKLNFHNLIDTNTKTN